MSLLNYSQSFIDTLPVATYACLAPHGYIIFANQRAKEIWGRDPLLLGTEQRFCGSVKMFRPDGSPLPHSECPMAEALRTGNAYHNQRVIIEREDGIRVEVMVNIAPYRNEAGHIVGAVNVFHPVA